MEQRVLMLGLDAAGKTTMLYKLCLHETVHTIPTIGFNVERVESNNIMFTIWDIGGQEKIRALWRHYFTGVNGIIFVVDSHDQERLQEAAEELKQLMLNDELRRATLLVFANKQDLPNSMTTAEITRGLGLHDLKSPWLVQGCVAVTGQGLYEGLAWFAKQLSSKNKE